MNKIKVGLLIDSEEIPFWAYKMLKEIIQSEYAEISLVVKKTNTINRKNFISKFIQSYKYIFYILFIKLDNKMSRVKCDAFISKNISSMINSIPTIEVITESKKFSDIFNHTDILNIKSHNIDVFIRLGFKILRGEILNSSKYGIWSYHHGDNKVNRGGPAGFWEVIENWNETGVTLQVLTEDLDGGNIIEKSFSCTDGISINRNKNNLYWKALSMIPRNLKKLYKMGGDKFMSEINSLNDVPSFYYNKLYKVPTNYDTFKYITKKYRKYFKNRFLNLFYFNQWILMYSFSSTTKISNSFFRFKKIIPPKDRFWADPFIVFKEDKHYIFIEELLYDTNKGYISVFTIDSNGNYTNPIKVLEKDYHLSYPFIIENEGSYYMIPESAENNTIDIYKCVEFPSKWEFVKTLINNVTAVDTTIHYYNNKYWMFTNIRENEGASTSEELYIFYSDNLISDTWIAHDKNPVISDVKRARSAGNIFIYNNNFYRPAQDCSKQYGWGMYIAKIKLLNEQEYIEEYVQNIYPNWDKNISATHTINFSNKLTMIDGLHKRSKYFFI